MTALRRSQKAHVLQREQVVPGTLEDVFSFFQDPYNLEAITPSWLNFSIVEATDRAVRVGTRIEYKLRWQGLSMRWSTLIAEHEPGVRFADQMTRGPYRSWYHVHTFKAVEGGVLMRDRVEYVLPFGPLGTAVHSLLIRSQLESIFDYRRTRIAEIFGGTEVLTTTTAGS